MVEFIVISDVIKYLGLNALLMFTEIRRNRNDQ